ncbi:hypothetical protein FHY19_000139 [Xanthomonas arboricola]|nr:hypothetical protein [Xanthomonas sp. 4461]
MGFTGKAHRAQGRSYNGVAFVVDHAVPLVNSLHVKRVLPKRGISPIPTTP